MRSPEAQIFFGGGAQPWHMKVPGEAYASGVATLGPLNPPCLARDRTCAAQRQSQILNLLCHSQNSQRH